MIGKFRSALFSVLGSEEAPLERPPLKYKYERPHFLSLKSEDELSVIADHGVRPIVLPREVLRWNSGYAETINGGKSLVNEDQARMYSSFINDDIEVVYFGVFDGHAGPYAAISASSTLHLILHERLTQIKGFFDANRSEEEPQLESLVIGALESAFHDMDEVIGAEKRAFTLSGGCTALVALFVGGKVYVANAGDSRALLVTRKAFLPLSFDFTPVSERARLQKLGELKPGLLGNEYSHLDYIRRPQSGDIGSKLLVRDSHMTGWSYKEIEESDLKFPVVFGEGKRSRLLATIGVTRGFGDHDLRAQSRDKDILIKPFLSSQPEVRVLDLSSEALEDSDVLIMATDGLWDVLSNSSVAQIVREGILNKYSDNNSYKYVSTAQELVMSARGKLDNYSWIRSDMSQGTIDDISVFVIPLTPYKKEFLRRRNNN